MNLDRDKLEFAISRLLDGDLSPAERLELEAALACDASARQLLAQMSSMNNYLRTLAGLPSVKWDRLGDSIAAAVADQHLSASAERPVMRLAADEALEDAVVRSLTGDLPRAEQTDLDRLAETDSAARELIAKHRSLNVALQHGLAVPHVDFDQLARRIGNAAVGVQTVRGEFRAIDETVEQAIVDHVDGDLTVAREDEIDKLLASDSSARETQRQHRSLAVLLQHAIPLPHVDWEMLHGQLSAAVAEQANEQSQDRTIKLSQWLRTSSRIAVAACIVLALTLAVRMLTRPASNTEQASAPLHKIILVDAQPAEPAGPRIIEVAFGPSDAIVSNDGFDAYAASAVVSMTPRVQVASNQAPPLDGEPAPVRFAD